MRNDVPVDARSLLSEPLEEARGKQHLAGSIWPSLAVLPGDEGSQVVLVLNHQLVPPPQNPRPVAACAGAPRWESGGGDSDGLLGILGYRFGARTDEGTAGWVCR